MNRGRGAFDGLPIPADKSYLKERLTMLDESWAAARFDSLPHVVQILTSKDRDGELQALKDQSELVEDVVDEVVHSYHHGFNKAIQNYSHILRLFSESAESISIIKSDMEEAKSLLGSRSKQLGQLWYRSLTLRHVLSLLDQIEDIAKVPARIKELMDEKQLYAAVQLYVRSVLMLEREGLQVVGALQDVRSELTKLRGVLFYKIVEELHSHLYNKGHYSSIGSYLVENGDVTAVSSHPISRRTKSMKGSSQLNGQLSADGIYKSSSVDGSSSFDAHDDESSLDISENEGGPGHQSNGYKKDSKSISSEIPSFLSHATPDEFIESMTKTDVPSSVKYLRTLVECLCLLGKVAAAGAVICQRLRSTIHDIITSKVKAYSEANASSSSGDQSSKDIYVYNGSIKTSRLLNQRNKNGTSFVGTQLVVSPIAPSMSPHGPAQKAANNLIGIILDTLVQILENHIIVSELLELKASTQNNNMNTPKATGDTYLKPDSETGGFTVSFSLSVVQSECQQLICEIIRATPEAAAADTAQAARAVKKKDIAKEKRDGSEGFSFAFRITDATVTQSTEDTKQGWRRPQNAQQEGYGTAAVLPELGIYLAASIYRPIFEFSDKIGSLLPQKLSNIGNDSLLAFVSKFIKENFLPAIFVDYRKCVQQAISSPAAFRPRIHSSPIYSPLVEKGRPVLQGLLAVDIIAKEVLGWAQLLPNYAVDLVEYVHTFLERTHERCRKSYMEAVLEKQSYILLSRNDVENLLRLDPASACLQSSSGEPFRDAENVEVESELSDLLLDLRPIKQETLIHDDQKLVLLASLSDSLEYLADSVERLGSLTCPTATNEDVNRASSHHHARTASAIPKNLASLANEYRRLAVDCLKVLRLEMQLETIFHLQEMTHRDYIEDQDAEEPDDFIISLTTQIQRREEELSPFVAEMKRSYIFGGISSVAANASIKALAQMKAINLLGVQQICRNSIALQQALEAIPSIDGDAVQKRLDRVRTFYELLNLPFESLLSFIAEHEYLFSAKEYLSLLKVTVPGREIPSDAERRISDILAH